MVTFLVTAMVATRSSDSTSRLRPSLHAAMARPHSSQLPRAILRLRQPEETDA
jgi:hypothetical protein